MRINLIEHYLIYTKKHHYLHFDYKVNNPVMRVTVTVSLVGFRALLSPIKEAGGNVQEETEKLGVVRCIG